MKRTSPARHPLTTLGLDQLELVRGGTLVQLAFPLSGPGSGDASKNIREIAIDDFEVAPREMTGW